MTTILITGADGFTGRYLAQALAALGHEVHGLVHREQALLPGFTAMHRGDLRDGAAMAAVLAAVGPDKLVHLAGISFVGHGNVDEIYQTNLLGTRHLLEAAKGMARPPSAILLASSANIYGNRMSGVIAEDCPPDPANDYAVSKLAMEYMARTYREQLPIIITRPFNYTGVGQPLQFLVPKIVDHIRRRAPFIELGNIDVDRDWSDVRMLVDAYVRLLDCPDAIGGTFNVCSGVARSLREVFDLACAKAGHQMEIRVNPAFVRANEVRTLSGSKALLESVIGPVTPIPIADTLEWMLGA